MFFDGEPMKGNVIWREKAMSFVMHLYKEDEDRRPRLDELPFK